MTRPSTIHSHPTCPTCQSDLTGKEELPRFCAEGSPQLVMNDDVLDLYRETVTLVRFLGSLAQAMPLATAQYEENTHSTFPDWLDNLMSLAGELAEEAQRRLALLRKAGQIWQERAEGKEG